MNIRLRLIIFFTIFIHGCDKNSHFDLITLLNDHYANLYVNEKHKRSVIKDLEKLLKTHELNDQNIPVINKVLNRIGDGHVVIYKNNSEPTPIFESSLEFYLGSKVVKSCSNCSPQIPSGKYRIIKVNQQSLGKYIQEKSNTVSASTWWGMKYRVLRSLSLNDHAPEIELKLRSSDGKIIRTKLNWTHNRPQSKICASGERLKENIYKLNVLSFWCDDPANRNESRKAILQRFKDQFDQAVSQIKTDDIIVLDLRENGGGSDQEVEYVLNTFNKNPVFMYKFQHLNATTVGVKLWIHTYLPFFSSLWDSVGYIYSSLGRNPAKYQLYDNKMVTLVSAGCFSSCEGLASALKFENRSILVGTTTHGGAGDPVLMPIKGTEYSINLPSCLVWQKDDSLFEGKGVYPNFASTQSFSQSGDTVLEDALLYLH